MDLFWGTIFYSLTTLTLFGVILSYILAFRLKPTLSICALLIFFIASWILVTLIAYNGWMTLLYPDYNTRIPFRSLRAMFYFLASLFLFYTTWRKNKTVLK